MAIVKSFRGKGMGVRGKGKGTFSKRFLSPSPDTQSSLPGKVWFVGAGPGDPELLTVKARRLIVEADLLLYAGSLVSPAIAALAGPGAKVHDSSGLTLEETHELLCRCCLAGGMAVRLHTGDPALYGAIHEQMLLLDAVEIEYGVVPGITSASAAAAEAKVSFTLPEVGQSLILTRISGRTPVPEGESLAAMAAHGCAMAIYLSSGHGEEMRRELGKSLPPETLIVCAHRLGWPGQKVVKTTLGRLADTIRDENMTRQTVFLVLPGAQSTPANSRLYDATFSHGWRNNGQL